MSSMKYIPSGLSVTRFIITCQLTNLVQTWPANILLIDDIDRRNNTR